MADLKFIQLTLDPDNESRMRIKAKGDSADFTMMLAAFAMKNREFRKCIELALELADGKGPEFKLSYIDLQNPSQHN